MAGAAGLSPKERTGCEKLLSMMPDRDLRSLLDTVRNCHKFVEQPVGGLIAKIIYYCNDAAEFLKRRKVQRDIILQYLAQEGIVMPPDSDKSDLVKRTLEFWSCTIVYKGCACGHCDRMPKAKDNVCCQEIPEVVRRMKQLPVPPTCMVDHPGLEPNCLNPYTLQNINNILIAEHGTVSHGSNEKHYRYLSNRSFVNWCWGNLRQNVGVVIPSCVNLRIRQEFPDGAGPNVEFRPPLD